MANEIKLVTYANSEVTPQNDAVLTNLEIASNGVIFGCNVTIKNASTLHINAGMGVVYGREFEIVDSDIPVSLSSSGTLLGQLYVHIDLANTSEPAQLLVDTGNSLTPLVDDPMINITTGSTDYQLATFTVDTSTLANLTETFSIVNNPTAIIGNTDISGIADGTVTGAVAQINTDLDERGSKTLLFKQEATSTSTQYTISDISEYKYLLIVLSIGDSPTNIANIFGSELVPSDIFDNDFTSLQVRRYIGSDQGFTIVFSSKTTLTLSGWGVRPVATIYGIK